MKKLSFSFLVLLFFSSCSLSPATPLAFEQQVGTQVSISKTATSISSREKTVISSTQTSTVTLQIKPTGTASIEDPKKALGTPNWLDTLNSGKNWSLESGVETINNTQISTENGFLVMTQNIATGGKTWWLNYLTIQDFYMDAKFIAQNCSGTDQYGLVLRAPNYDDGYGYYFTITCDGRFTLMKWDSLGATNLFSLEQSPEIISGPNQVNEIGIWMKGSLIRLYANQKLLKEINDGSLTNSGHFGVFIDARETPGFTIMMDQIEYWELK